MPRPWLLLPAAVLAAAAFAPASGGPPDGPAAAVVGAGLVAAANPAPVDDPLPLTRLRVPADRLAEALKAVDPGPLVRLPRADFEARVRAAGRAVADGKLVPRLLGARYAATLADGDLTGEAEWVVFNPRPGPAWLPLDPLRLAVRSAIWADGSDALLGTAGNGPGVWVPAAGRQTLKLGWSAAGSGPPDAPAFDLRLPPAPAAVLALTLPADRAPTAAPDVLVTGPEPAADGRRVWHLRFGGRSRLEFTARGPGNGPGAVVASLVARYDLSPAETAAVFEYDLRPTRGPVGEWAFAVPPGLRVTDVEANDRAGWRVDPSGKELRVTLRQPAAAVTVRITATAPPGIGGEPTPLPVIRPAGAAIIESEKLDVRIDPDLAVGGIDPGGYRLADTAPTANDGRAYSFVGSRPADEPPADQPFRRPPAVRLSPAGCEFTASEAVEWRVAAGRAVATARVTLRPRRGPLFGLTVRTPAGYEVDRVATAPDDRVGHAPPAADGPGVAVTFTRPVAAGQSLDLLLTLRGPPVPSEGGRFPVPVVEPIGAAERDGWVAVAPGPGWRASVRLDPGVVEAAADPATPAPSADAAVTAYWRTRPPAGDIILSPAPAAQPPPTAPEADIPAPPVAPAWAFADLRLTTVAADPPVVQFDGTVTTAAGPDFPVALPDGTTVEAVTVDGRAAGIGPRVPVPAGGGPARFAVRYRLPAAGGWLREVSSPVPELPGGPHPVRRVWAFPADAAPAWPIGVRGPAATLPAEFGGVTGMAVMAYPGGAVEVVPDRWVGAAGVLVAAGFAAAGWVAARARGRWAGVLLLVALAAVGAAGLIGPAAWGRAAKTAVAVGTLSAGAVAVARGRRRRPRPTAGVVRRVWQPVAAASVALLLAGLSAVAQPDARDTVFLLPPTEGDGKEFVLAPRPLLDRLDAAAKPPVPPPVVTAAEYDGRAEDGLARFAARFVVHTFAPGETLVPLPLAGVQLEGAAADGRPAAPASPRPDLYTVPVAGPGRHEITVRFAVPVTATGPEREARFGVPGVPAAKVAFAVPAGAGPVQAVGRFGSQAVGNILAGPRLTADLGAARTVQLRWRQGAAGPAAVAVREGCVWDATEAGDRLTACYLARVTAGAAAGFRFDLPTDLEPVRAAVQALTPGASAPVARWSVGAEANGVRPLQIDLAGPAEGRLLVTLECVRRGPPTRRPVLRFPRPEGMTREGGVYGLRATGAAVEGVEREGVIDFAADALSREFQSVPDLRLSPAVPVLAFSPQGDAAAELRPTVRPGPDPAEASEEVTWRVGPARADGEGTIRWAAREPLATAEFAVPGVKVAEVRGPEVAGWAEAGGRVQVWFRRPARAGQFRWSGALDHTGPTVELPTAAFTSMKPAGAVLRVLPADGFTVRADRAADWKAVPAGGRGVALRADGPAPPVRVEVVPSPVVPPQPPAAVAVAVAPEPRPVATLSPTPAAVPPPAEPAALPVRAAAGWGLGVLLVAVLFVLLPGRTWPEQVGLLGGLFGVAVGGGLVVGVAAWGLARGGWLLSRPAAAGARG